MSFIIGVNTRQGLYDKTQFKRGDIPSPGTIGRLTDPSTGATREFMAVKFTSNATRINGTLITIDPDGVATLGTVDAGNLLVTKRAGILTYNASAVATQTMTGTHFGWAQIYGKGKGRVAATMTVSLVDQMLEPGADGLVALGAVASTSANLYGLTAAIASTFPPGLIDVFLNYPQYADVGD
jgi:hypothetical protein